MQSKLIQYNLKQRENKDMPELRSGDIVRVHRRIKEGEKERVQVFEGMIIAIKGGQSSSPMITVRKVSFGVGVELIIPIYSPHVEKIELVRRAKVRKAKLYYTRTRTAKQMRMKYVDLTEEKAKSEVKEEAPKEEAKASKKEDKKEKEEVKAKETENKEDKKEVKEEKKEEAKK